MVGSKGAGQIWDFNNCVVIVAHPDDEILWAGGAILMHPDCKWTILSLCRGSDSDRAARFYKTLEYLHATGKMADVDDGPEQRPLTEREVQNAILSLLPLSKFDLILTHSLWGEYTRHIRHEETAKAVLALRESGELTAKQVWIFAYEDGGKRYLPRPVRDADIVTRLPEEIWQKKYKIITQIYGFEPESWEAKTTPREEAFWRLLPGKKK